MDAVRCQVHDKLQFPQQAPSMIRLSLILLSFWISLGTAMAGDWVRYVNERYGTNIDYPVDLFTLARAPDNGDGQSFEATSGETLELIVWAGINIDERDIDGIAREFQAADEKVTYRKKGSDWVVMSGFKNHDIFYRKAILSADGQVIHYMELTYPSSDKSRYDAVVARISRSFSAGN